jgi:hypothetical protein
MESKIRPEFKIESTYSYLFLLFILSLPLLVLLQYNNYKTIAADAMMAFPLQIMTNFHNCVLAPSTSKITEIATSLLNQITSATS